MEAIYYFRKLTVATLSTNYTDIWNLIGHNFWHFFCFWRRYVFIDLFSCFADGGSRLSALIWPKSLLTANARSFAGNEASEGIWSKPRQGGQGVSEADQLGAAWGRCAIWWVCDLPRKLGHCWICAWRKVRGFPACIVSWKPLQWALQWFLIQFLQEGSISKNSFVCLAFAWIVKAFVLLYRSV